MENKVWTEVTFLKRSYDIYQRVNYSTIDTFECYSSMERALPSYFHFIIIILAKSKSILDEAQWTFTDETSTTVDVSSIDIKDTRDD